MKMTLKEAIEEAKNTDTYSISTNSYLAIKTLIDHARATEHAPMIGKQVYYNGIKGELVLGIKQDKGDLTVIYQYENIRPIPSATLDELKQTYCEYHGVDDVEVEG
jgi:hypothetical protein